MNFIPLLPELAGLTPEDFAYDYSQRIPVTSIIAMVLAIILAVAVPILIFIYVKKRYSLNSQIIIYGLLSYMLGGYLLPYLIMIGLQLLDSSTGIFTAVPAVYAVLISVITAVLEFAALYLGLRFIHKRTPINVGNAILFAVFFCVFPLLTQTISNLGSYLSVSITVNGGGLRDAVANMIEANETTKADVESLLAAMTSLFTESFFYYIFMVLDVLLLLLVRAGVCILLAGGMLGKLKKPQTYYSFIIIALYAAIMFLRYCGAVENYVFAELLYLVLAVVSLFFAYHALSHFMQDDLKRLTGKPDPALNKKKDDDKPGSSGHKMPKIVMPKD